MPYYIFQRSATFRTVRTTIIANVSPFIHKYLLLSTSKKKEKTSSFNKFQELSSIYGGETYAASPLSQPKEIVIVFTKLFFSKSTSKSSSSISNTKNTKINFRLSCKYCRRHIEGELTVKTIFDGNRIARIVCFDVCHRLLKR